MNMEMPKMPLPEEAAKKEEIVAPVEAPVKESVEARLEKLNDDERKFLEIQKKAEAAIGNLTALRYKKQIEETDYRNMVSQIEFLRHEASVPMVEKIGEAKAREIGRLKFEVPAG